MLKIHIPETDKEFFNDKTEEFITVKCKETDITLEHSLISISKWEDKYHQPFLNIDKPKTTKKMKENVKLL